MSFSKVEADVREILKRDMAARCDDHALYCAYVWQKLESINYDHKAGGWLVKVMTDTRFRVSHGIAPYGTVSRMRRKLQAEDCKLQAPDDVIQERKRMIKKYKEYVTGAENEKKN